MSLEVYPLGKLPPELLKQIFNQFETRNKRLLVGPGIGLDCAVVDNGTHMLQVIKSDPITFATDEIGWYALQVAANDVATTGAIPLWYSVTLLLPEDDTTEGLVLGIMAQLAAACKELNVTLVGGHSEVTYGLKRPIIMGTLIGEVPRDRLVIPAGARPGDSILLTKGIPIEATALLAREFPERLLPHIGMIALQQAANFLHSPGISITKDAYLATHSGRVTAMHDPTEGGLASALWELAEASGNDLVIDPTAILIPPLSQQICTFLGLNPLATLASGALLLTTYPEDASTIIKTLKKAGITCREIGSVEKGIGQVWAVENGLKKLLARPGRDEITKIYEQLNA